MAEEERTIIVGVGDHAFKVASEKGIYAFPDSYNRKIQDYIAFYQTSPVSAVTHYAKIEGESDESNKLTSKDKIRMFPRLSSDAVVWEIGELKELEKPVEADRGTGVQGAWYVPLEKIKSADKLSDLK